MPNTYRAYFEDMKKQFVSTLYEAIHEAILLRKKVNICEEFLNEIVTHHSIGNLSLKNYKNESGKFYAAAGNKNRNFQVDQTNTRKMSPKPDRRISNGNFIGSQSHRGNRHANLVNEVAPIRSANSHSIGSDLAICLNDVSHSLASLDD